MDVKKVKYNAAEDYPNSLLVRSTETCLYRWSISNEV